MKKIIFILLYSPLLCFSQSPVTLSGGTVTVSGTGTIEGDSIKNTVVMLQPQEIRFEYPHSKQAFRDSAVVIAGGTNVQITNASDSLWRVLEMDKITYLRGDTVYVDYKGAYNVIISIDGYGTNAVDWQVAAARKRAGVTTYSDSVGEFTTTGATNKNGMSKTFYMDYEVGDKTWFVISRIGGSGDFTATTSSVYYQFYYSMP